MRWVGASFEPLRERPFRLLFFGRSLSAIGDAVVPVALTFAVLKLGDATDLGIVLGVQTATQMLMLVVGGVWADRLPRQLLMIGADLVRAVVQTLIAIAFFTDRIAIWQFAVGAAVFGVASAFFNPASTGLVPQLVSGDRLQEANALLGLARSSIQVLGPLIAGLLVAWVGFGVVFAIDAASFVASLFCLAALRLPARVASQPRTSMLKDARAGLRIVLERRWMIAHLASDLGFNLAIPAYFVLGPVIFERHFDGIRGWSLLMTAGAIGAILGGLITLRLKPRRPMRLVYTVGIITPLQLLALSGPLPLPVLMVGAAGVVVAIVFVNTYGTTMAQHYIPREYLSRVDSLGWTISLIAYPLGAAAVGPLSHAIGINATLIVAVVVMCIALAIALGTAELRNLPRPASTESAVE